MLLFYDLPGNHFFAEDHLFKNMDELQQGSGPFLDSRNHNQTRKEEYESKLNGNQ
jgi:hypothetical protein